MYPTLTLDQVYLAIGYYLRHRDTVDTYIKRMDEEARHLRQEWETTKTNHLTQAELLARLRDRRDDAG